MLDKRLAKLKLFLVATGLLISVGAASDAGAQVPHVMNYQGRLSDGDAPASGVYSVTFTLHTRASGGEQVWSEPHEVTVTDGVFNVLLGSTTPLSPDILAARDSLYLGMRVSDVELTPRLLLASTPFAVRAAEAETVAAGGAVLSLNGQRGAVTLQEGSNISITEGPGTLTITAVGGGSGGGGDITRVSAGTGLTGGGAAGDVTLSLIDGGVTEGKLAIGAVTTAKLADGAVTSAKLAPGSLVTGINKMGGEIEIRAAGGATVTSSNNVITINAGSGGGGTGIQGVQNTDNAIQILDPSGPTATLNVSAGGIKATMLAANAVTRDKLAAAAVDNAKLADGAVTGAKLANNAVTAEKLANGTVNGDKLANGAVTITKIAPNAVDASKLTGNAAVLSLNGMRGAVAIEGGSNITVTESSGTITVAATGIGAGDITAVNPGTGLTGGGASGDVTLSLAGGGVTSAHLADNAVTANKLADNAAVLSLNGQQGSVQLQAGSNITITEGSGAITISSAGDTGGGTTGVQAINGLSGDINLVGQGLVNITRDGQTIYIGGGGIAIDDNAAPSSIRWKTDVSTIEDAVALVEQLRGVRYAWKEDGRADIGLIAEEVGEVVPEIVEYEENGVDAKTVSYAKLVAVLIEAVKQQQQQLEAQEQQRTADQAMMQELLSRVARLEASQEGISARASTGDDAVSSTN